MPTYEYLCEGCGHRFDEFQSFKDDALKTCPKCQEEKLRRLFGTGAAILFKGSGFYETDYRSDSYKQAAKADKDGGGKASEAKPADSTTTNGMAPAKTETKSSPPPA
jgi:putative FmdB family regulatory protein